MPASASVRYPHLAAFSLFCFAPSIFSYFRAKPVVANLFKQALGFLFFFVFPCSDLKASTTDNLSGRADGLVSDQSLFLDSIGLVKRPLYTQTVQHSSYLAHIWGEYGKV